MSDPMLNVRPDQSRRRRVIRAEAQAIDPAQQLFRVIFEDSDGKQMAIQLKVSELRSIVETANALLARG